MSPSNTLSPDRTNRWPRRELNLEDLKAEARRLLHQEPALHGPEREAAVRELIDVDLQLERVGLRARWTPLADQDLAELQDCSRRLERLRCCWVPER